MDWRQKLSSRKFWAAVAAFVTTLLTALGVVKPTIEQAVTIIGGLGVLCVYIFGESRVDASWNAAAGQAMAEAAGAPQDGSADPED